MDVNKSDTFYKLINEDKEYMKCVTDTQCKKKQCDTTTTECNIYQSSNYDCEYKLYDCESYKCDVKKKEFDDLMMLTENEFDINDYMIDKNETKYKCHDEDNNKNHDACLKVLKYYKSNIEKNNNTKHELEEKLKNCKSYIEKNNNSKHELEEQLKSYKMKNMVAEKKIKTLIKCQKDCQEQVEYYKSLLKKTLIKLNDLKKAYDILNKKYLALVGENDKYKKRLMCADDKILKLEKLLKDNKAQQLVFAKQIECLVNDLKKCDSKNEKLTEDIEKLTKKIKFKDCLIKKLENIICGLNNKLSCNNQQISLLQKENKCLKKQLQYYNNYQYYPIPY